MIAIRIRSSVPLNSQLLIIGPPGTGKTTTLIRRLGQKLDREYLNDDERRSADGGEADGALPHADSWMMYTPTDLLKLYLKEAFAREHIAAPDQKLSTWSRFRLDLARNHFRFLRTPNGGGPFILKDAEFFVRTEALDRQTAWYEDFVSWQTGTFWAELQSAAKLLAKAENADARRLSQSLTTIVAKGSTESLARALLSLVHASENVDSLLHKLKEDTDRTIRRSLNLQVNRNPRFLEELAGFLDGLSTADEELDDSEAEEEDEVRTQLPRTRLARAMDAYMSNVRSQARARFSGRTLPRTSNAGRISEWTGNRTLPEDSLRSIGERLQTQAALRCFVGPVRRYINGIAARYRRFRRVRQAEHKWYVADTIGANDVGPLEVDVMLLSAMRTAASLLRDRNFRRNIDDKAFAPLKAT